MLARIQGAPSRSEIPTLLNIDLPCLSQTGEPPVSAAYSQNLHHSGALQASRQPLPSAQVSRGARIYLVGEGAATRDEWRSALWGSSGCRSYPGKTWAASARPSPVCRLVAARPATQSSPSGERGKNEDAKSRPGRDGLLRFLSRASCGLGRLRLGRVKYSPRRLREDAVRRVSTPERLHCVDHPTLVGDPVGLRSAGTWREAPRSFSGNMACRRRGLEEWSNDVHRVWIDSTRGAGRTSKRSRCGRGRTRAGVVLTDDDATLAPRLAVTFCDSPA